MQRTSSSTWTPTYQGGAARKVIRLRRAAREMLVELESNLLHVELVPSDFWDCAMRGGKKRAVQYQNAEWYQDFCSEYTARRREMCRIHKRTRKVKGRYCTCLPKEKEKRRWKFRNRRKHDTAIKRQDTIRGLRELIRGQCVSGYAQRLADFIERRLANKRVA